ncbi:hypothetical protein GCM10011506_24670 [Marivirga lumbricoides]|uniref:Uncharacterized protein n=1 Tax=Marivirga lumbricoides TaxID=1046115 RepID=A0ABQ1MGL4_9BACT|nr:hypothetical protein GCM10011506_24670 [Marivirga lumbricoides]
MTEESLKDFILHYSKKDFEDISFYWNGRHGEDFEDLNYDLRMDVCEYLVKDLRLAPDQLIVDLYTELAKSAEQTFGVYNKFHLFANELLLRGGSKYIDIYINGATRSMDTSLMSSRLDLPKSILNEITEFLEQKIKTEPRNKVTQHYLHMLKRFTFLRDKKNISANN